MRKNTPNTRAGVARTPSEKIQDWMRDHQITGGLQLMGVVKEVQNLEMRNYELQDEVTRFNDRLAVYEEFRSNLKRFVEGG